MSALAELARGVIEAVVSLLGRQRPIQLTKRKRVDRVPTRHELEEEARTHDELARRLEQKR